VQRAPPTSPLFPYTTLFRSNKKAVLTGVGLAFALSITMAWIMAQNYKVDVNKDRYKLTKDYAEAKDQDYTFNEENGRSLYEGMRSEEHTSELQSRENLVCRL